MRSLKGGVRDGAKVLTLAAALAGAAAQQTHASNEELDAALVEKLQYGPEVTEEISSRTGPRLTPAEIRALRDKLDLERAARGNPLPPKVKNKVLTLERGESPTINIMQRFDTTLVFADRAGNPLTIRSARVSDSEAATIIPLHDNPAAVYEDSDEGASQASGDSEGSANSFEPPRNPTGHSGEQRGPVNALIISPSKSMRSTNLTVRVEGEDYPIILTVRSHPSSSNERTIAYMQEVRLDWLVNMPREQQLSGKYQVGSELGEELISLLQGVPTPNLEKIELEGALKSEMSLWRDATERTSTYYLRMADYISPWNIAIADQSHDRMRGFTVIELQGAPPRSIGLSANGNYTTMTIAE